MTTAIARLRDWLSTRRQAYVRTFNDPMGDKVLRDLAKFCKAGKTLYHPDQRMTDIMIGRQEVFNRIQEHLRLTDDELWELYDGREDKPE